MSPVRAAICSVGDELMVGKHPDLNAPYLARELSQLGVQVVETVVVGDDESHLAATLRRLGEGVDLLFVSGGLGPTLDDVTRHAAAKAAGVALEEDPLARAQVEGWYADAGRDMPASNLRQALIPRGGTVVANPVGTAPGFQLALGRATAWVLPGPPRELQAMWGTGVCAQVEAQLPGVRALAVHEFHLQGLSESVFADLAGDWMDRDADPQVGVTVARGVLSARLVARAQDLASARKCLGARADQFRERFAEWLFSEHNADPAAELVARLRERGLWITAAESCTGGLVASALTSVPGASEVLARSLVTYANAAKEQLLGVPAELLATHGAVSEPVARAMALGAAASDPSVLGLATTGVAGPGGGSPEKPVGMVCFGVALGGEVWSSTRAWPSGAGRDAIRSWATSHALVLAIRALEGRLGPSGRS